MTTNPTYLEMRGYDDFYDNLVHILKKFFGTVENYCYERSIEDDVFEKFYGERKISVQFIDALLRDGILERGDGKLHMAHSLLVECAQVRLLQNETPYQWMNRTQTHVSVYINYFVMKDPMHSVTKQLLEDGYYCNCPLPFVRPRRKVLCSTMKYYYEQRANERRISRNMHSKVQTQWMNTEDLEALEAKLYLRFGNEMKTVEAIGVSYFVYYHFFRRFRYSYMIMRWLYAEGYVTSETLPPALENPLRKWCKKNGKEIKDLRVPKLLDERTLMPWEQVKVNALAADADDEDLEPTEEELAALEIEEQEHAALEIASLDPEEAKKRARFLKREQKEAAETAGRPRGRPRKWAKPLLEGSPPVRRRGRPRKYQETQ